MTWLQPDAAAGENCAREARLLTRQLDASRMTDDSLNVEAQTGTDAWLHSCTAGVPRNISKEMMTFRYWPNTGKTYGSARTNCRHITANNSRVAAACASFYTHPPDSITPLHLICDSITEEQNLIMAGDADGSYHPTGRSNYLAGLLSWSAIPEWVVCLIIAAS